MLHYSVALFVFTGVLSAASGYSVADDRILGGNNAPINKYSYMALLKLFTNDNKVGFCSGTIINEKTILTNAACFQIPKLFKIEVYARFFHMSQLADGALNDTAAVNNIVIHPNFNPGTLENNVGLVKLNEPLNLKDKWCLPKEPKTCVTVSTVKLADAKAFKGHNLEMVKGNIAGWGATDANGPKMSAVLQEATLQVETASVCQRKWGANFKPVSQLCAANGRSATCLGDHGSPLVIEGHQVGIANGMSCNGNQGTSFTRVSHYYDWIQKNLAK